MNLRREDGGSVGYGDQFFASRVYLAGSQVHRPGPRADGSRRGADGSRLRCRLTMLRERERDVTAHRRPSGGRRSRPRLRAAGDDYGGGGEGSGENRRRRGFFPGVISGEGGNTRRGRAPPPAAARRSEATGRRPRGEGRPAHRPEAGGKSEQRPRAVGERRVASVPPAVGRCRAAAAAPHLSERSEVRSWLVPPSGGTGRV